MSKFLRAVGQVASVVATVAAFVPGGQGIALAASAVAATASIGSQLTAKRPSNERQGQQLQFKIDPDGPIPFGMGRYATGGTLAHRETYGTDNIYQTTFVVLGGGGPYAGIEAFTADRAVVALSGTSALGYYADWLWQDRQLGATPEARALGSGIGRAPKGTAGPVPNWGPAYKLSGFAAASLSYRYDTKGERYVQGEPLPGWIMRGRLVYDPRLDSTYPGGSGPCRWADPSDTAAHAAARATWVYSDSPALHGLMWRLGIWVRNEGDPNARYQKIGGIGAPIDLIDLPAIVHAANVQAANGWTIGGEVYSDQDKWEVLKLIEQAGGCEPIAVGATMSTLIKAPRVPLRTITAADLADGKLSAPAMRARSERINGFRARFRSEAHGWEITSIDIVQVPRYVEEDGRAKTGSGDFSLVTDPNQCAELAAYEVFDSRELEPIAVSLKPFAVAYRLGDCLTLDLPEIGLQAREAIVRARSVDPASGIVTLTLRSETAAKHPACLGMTGDTPPTPTLTAEPDVIAMPSASAWSASMGYAISSGIQVPAILISGAVDNSNADGVLFEYRQEGASDWLDAGLAPPDTTSKVIAPVEPEAAYEVGIRYRGRGIYSGRLLLKPGASGTVGVEWPVVYGPDRPADNATNSADPNSPFGPDGQTVEQVILTLEQVPLIDQRLSDFEGVAGDAAAIAAAREAAQQAQQNAEAAARDAGTYRTAAGGYAQTATGAAETATDAAAAAATSESVTAETANLALGRTFPPLSPATLKLYNIAGGELMGPNLVEWPVPYLLNFPSGRAASVHHLRMLPNVVGRRYRASAIIYSYATNARFGWQLNDYPSDDVSAVARYVGGGVDGSDAPREVRPSGPGFKLVQVEFTGSAGFQPYLLPYLVSDSADGQPINGGYHISGITIEDVTESTRAKASATDASQAAVAADGSASAARQARVAAESASGEATRLAGIARDQAAVATDKAAAAQDLYQLSASLANNAINRAPTFGGDWPGARGATPNPHPKWPEWGTAGAFIGKHPTYINPQTGQPPLQIDRNGSEHGAAQELRGDFPKGWYVLSADVRLEDGDHWWAGLLAYGLEDGYPMALHFGSTAAIGEEVANRNRGNGRYRFEALVFNDRDRTVFNLHPMAGWGGWGGAPQGFLRTIWFEATFRRATAEEVAVGKPGGTLAKVAQLLQALAKPDGALATYQTDITARFEGNEASIVNAFEAIGDEAGERARAITNLGTAVDGHTRTLQQQATINTDLTGRTAMRWAVVQDYGNGQAGISLVSDNAGYREFLVAANMRVNGDLLVDGTFTARKIDRNSVLREAKSAFSGFVSPAPGQTATVPWSLGLSQIPPLGRFFYEYTFELATNAGQRDVTNLNGRPAYTDYVEDGGGLSVAARDAQGNIYAASPNSSAIVLATTDFAPSWSATVTRGSRDTGWINEGDYYRREVAATYTLTFINLKVTWGAI